MLAARGWPPVWYYCWCCCLGYCVHTSEKSSHHPDAGIHGLLPQSEQDIAPSEYSLVDWGRNQERRPETAYLDVQSIHTLTTVVFLLQHHRRIHSSTRSSICSFICPSTFLYLLSTSNVPEIVFGTGDTMSKADLVSDFRKLHFNGRRQKTNKCSK